VMHAYAEGPDLDRLIARPHGDRPGIDMHCASRTAGCPSAERKVLTQPTGGASPGFAPRGVESPFAQPRHSGRADDLKRRRTARDDFLGREGTPSQSPSRKGRRQTLYSCLVQPQVDARFQKDSLAPVSRASSKTSRKKTGLFSPVPGCAFYRLLDSRRLYRLRRPALPTPRSR
jgi:hypothetical protein